MPLPATRRGKVALPDRANAQTGPFPDPAIEASNIRTSLLFRKRRNFVLAGAVAVITIAGTLIGASLKSKQQTVEKKTLKQQVQIDTTKQIQLLESTRGQLMQQKFGLERKIEELNIRRDKRRALEMERERIRGLSGGNTGERAGR